MLCLTKSIPCASSQCLWYIDHIRVESWKFEMIECQIWTRILMNFFEIWRSIFNPFLSPFVRYWGGVDYILSGFIKKNDRVLFCLLLLLLLSVYYYSFYCISCLNQAHMRPCFWNLRNSWKHVFRIYGICIINSTVDIIHVHVLL